MKLNSRSFLKQKGFWTWSLIISRVHILLSSSWIFEIGVLLFLYKVWRNLSFWCFLEFVARDDSCFKSLCRLRVSKLGCFKISVAGWLMGMREWSWFLIGHCYQFLRCLKFNLIQNSRAHQSKHLFCLWNFWLAIYSLVEIFSLIELN